MLHKNRTLLKLVKPQRLAYSFSILFLVVASFFSFLVPYIGKVTIDQIIFPNGEPPNAMVQWAFDQLGGITYLKEQLWISGLLLVFVTVMSGLFMYLKDYMSASASGHLIQDLRDRLFHHIHHLPSAYHAKADTGDLLQRCTSDIDTIQEFLTKQVMNIGKTVIWIATVIPLMLIQDWKLSFLSLCIVPFILYFAFHFFDDVKNVFNKVDEAEAELTTVVQENLTGIRVVRAFARQSHEIAKFEEKNLLLKEREYAQSRVLAKFWSVSDILGSLQIALVLLGGGWLASQNHITMGTFFAFITYVNMLVWPIRDLGRDLSETGKAVVAIGRVQEILDAKLEPDTTDPIFLPERLKGDIEFKNVSFAFRPEEPILTDLNFKIEAGETVAIVGPTGSGKSTLIQLLLRLYDFHLGTILLDGNNIRKIERKDIRRQVGTLLQEPFLYSRSLRENIKFGNHLASEQEMIESSKAASIHESIIGFDKGYETVIGERGVNLSGGQRQRVTLSRTFLKNTPILVLDDTLSAVDSKTEQKILSALKKKQGRQTVLMITHRISCCQKADKILVLQNGRLSQMGTHESLMEKEGFYQDLWKIQMGQEQEFLENLQRNAS